MIASIQIASAVRAVQAAAASSAQSSETSTAANFGSVLGQYHTPSEDGSETASDLQGGKHSQQDSSSYKAPAATPNPASATKTNPALAAAAAQDQETSASATISESSETSAETSSAAKFRGLLSRIRSLRSLEETDASSAPSQKPASVTETAMAPFLATPTSEASHLKLPLTSSLTLKQSGSASQNTSAAATEAAPAVETEAPIPVAPPQVQNEEATTSAGSLAFAARLNPSTETQPAASNAPVTLQQLQQQAQTPVESQAATKQVAATSDSSSDSRTDAHSSGGGFQSPQQNTSELFAKPEVPMAQTAVTASASAPASPDRSSGDKTSSPLPTAAQMDRVIEPPATSSNTNHDVTIRIPDATDGGMAVRFVQRAGEVYVSVRTSDTEMAQTLRGGLTDLVSSLQDGGIRTEVWQPGSDTSSSQGDPQHAFTNPDGSNGNSSSSGSNSEQEANPQNKPRWVEEMENSIGTIKETSQLWQA